MKHERLMFMKIRRYVLVFVQSRCYTLRMTTILSRASRALVLALAISSITAAPLFAEAATTKAAVIATATIDAATLSSEKGRPTLSGDATGLKKIRLTIEDAKGKSVLKRSVSVRKEEWKLRITKTLKTGTYTVRILDSSSSKAHVLTTKTLTIGNPSVPSDNGSNGPKSSGLISVDSLPLLAGGTAAQGATVPIAYLKVQNTSGSPVNLEGFTLKQNGSASAANVIGFSTNDDKGGSRTTIGGLETTKQFKNGTSYVPLAATIASGQVRIFTIKAILSKNAGLDLGKQLFIDVTGVTANGGVKAAYPIRGAAWTLIH